MMLASPIPAAPLGIPWRRIARVLRNAALVLVAFLVLGNVFIATAWQIQSRRAEPVAMPSVDVKNLTAVDEHVWRGAAPSKTAYAQLAAAGVTTIVDLRAEENVDPSALTERAAALGMRYVHIPMRDGQAPSPGQVDRFLAAVRDSDGITYVHCGAGVGRTGAMSAAYLVASGNADGVDAMRRNLAVGPPSLEQLVFAATLDGSGTGARPTPVVAASRFLDAPRRLWSRYGL